jgi:hypothetical protein
MDIISYGIASKAVKQEQFTRNDVLGIGVEGTHPHVKARIDNLEKAIQGVVAQADKLIVNDAINIMKAHAKLNAVVKSMKYKMHNMIFDDLLDLSGIDTTKSSGYVHDATNGLIKANGTVSYTVITKIENTDEIPEKVVLTVEEAKPGSLINVMPIMTSATTNGITVTESSKLGNNINYGGWKVFDGNITNYNNGVWITNATATGWIKIDFGSTAKNIVKYSIRSRNTTPTNSAPKAWTFDGSNDGITWTTLHSVANEIGWSPGQRREYSFTNTQSYRYYRINITQNNGDSSNLCIQEMELFENQPSVINAVPEGIYSISRDGGVTFESISPETLFYFTAKSPADKKLVLKAELPANVQLLNYALTWA